MSYVVIEPLVVVTDLDGQVKYHYQGARFDDCRDADRLLADGFIAQGDSVPLERPPVTAAKHLWVDYAVTVGFDRDEAESLTKQGLIEALQ